MTNASAQDIVAWQSGEIVFDGMPLGRAVAEFNRYLDRKIIVGDPSDRLGPARRAFPCR